MNNLLLIMLLLIGIAFIAFGILILFLPEVFENKQKLPIEKESKKRLGFFFWLKAQPKPYVYTLTGILLLALIVSLIPSSPASSSGSSVSSSNSTNSSNTMVASSTGGASSSVQPSSSDTPSSQPPSSSLLVQYIVTFDAREGTPVDAQTIEDNGLLVEVTSTKTGNTFDGWYLSEDSGVTLGTKWDFSTTFVTSDVTLYAKWIINNYTISFVNYVGGPGIVARTVAYQAIPTAPAESYSSGYTFGGWFTEPEFTTQYTFTEPMPANSFTLYAKWTANSYTMTFYPNGAAAIDPITADFGTAITWPGEITKDDNLFGGWYGYASYDGSILTPQTTMPGYNLNAYAKWFRLFSDIQVGGNFSFGTAPSGRIYAWGSNANGQLGNGATAIRQNTPTLFTINALNEGETITKFNLSNSYAFATTSEGRIFTWGETPNGRILTPTLFTIAGLNLNETISSIHTNPSGSHSFFITSSNRVFAQGNNLYGQLGRGSSGFSSSAATPILINFAGLSGGEFVDRFSVGGTFTVALTNQNRIYVMGENRGYQLGDGTTSERNAPTIISNAFLNGENISYIRSGKDHTFLITSNNKIFVWGLNATGTGATYGDGTTANVSQPTEMVYTFLNVGETITELEVGSVHNYVRTSSGRYFAWGFGGESRLANGSNTASTTPIAFTTPTLGVGETIVNIISSPGPVTYMITSTNRTLAFGRGMDGQIGDGDPNMASATAVKGSPIFI